RPQRCHDLHRGRRSAGGLPGLQHSLPRGGHRDGAAGEHARVVILGRDTAPGHRMLRATHRTWRRALLVVLVVLGGSGLALSTGAPPSAAVECPMPPGYVQVIRQGNVVVETVYCPPGWEDWGYEPDPGSGDTGGGD